MRATAPLAWLAVANPAGRARKIESPQPLSKALILLRFSAILRRGGIRRNFLPPRSHVAVAARLTAVLAVATYKLIWGQEGRGPPTTI